MIAPAAVAAPLQVCADTSVSADTDVSEEVTGNIVKKSISRNLFILQVLRMLHHMYKWEIW